jgi:hypothetical protein
MAYFGMTEIYAKSFILALCCAVVVVALFHERAFNEVCCAALACFSAKAESEA